MAGVFSAGSQLLILRGAISVPATGNALTGYKNMVLLFGIQIPARLAAFAGGLWISARLAEIS